MDEKMLTRRNTHEAKEMEPKIPDSASRSGNGAVAHIVAIYAGIWVRKGILQNDKTRKEKEMPKYNVI